MMKVQLTQCTTSITSLHKAITQALNIQSEALPHWFPQQNSHWLRQAQDFALNLGPPQYCYVFLADDISIQFHKAIPMSSSAKQHDHFSLWEKLHVVIEWRQLWFTKLSTTQDNPSSKILQMLRGRWRNFPLWSSNGDPAKQPLT